MKIDYVSPSLGEWFKTVKEPLKYGEIVMIQTLFGTGFSKFVIPERNDGSYFSRIYGVKDDQYTFIDLLENSKIVDLVKSISQVETRDLLICVYHFEEFVRGSVGMDLLELLLNKRKVLGWRLMFVTHEDLYSNNTLERFFDRSISLFPYVRFFPLWDKSTTIQYLKGKYSLDDIYIDFDRVYEQSGGWAILAKRITTNLLLGQSSNLLEGELLWLVEKMWLKLSLEQRQIINGIHKQGLILQSYPLVLAGLVKMGLTDIDKRVITVELLSRYLDLASAKLPPIISPSSDLIIDGVVLSGKLSVREEKVLRTILENGGKVISKESLIENVWEGAEVSDWAVDSLVSRLRRRLNSLGVKSKLVTKKGRGYVWQL